MIRAFLKKHANPISMKAASMDRRHTFTNLDALRGVAALVVAERHMGDLFNDFVLQRGALAVDMFFALSGFVIAHAYEKRMSEGLPMLQFLRIRLARLYPLYFLGLLIGVLAAIPHLHSNHVDSWKIAMALCFGLAIIPMPLKLTDIYASTFPFDAPSWSLFFELLANGIHIVIARWLNRSVLIALLGISFLLLVVSSYMSRDVDILGRYRPWFVAGVARVGFSYLMGIALYRLYRSGILIPKVPAMLIIMAEVVLLALPGRLGGFEVDLFLILVAFPALLLLAARAEPMTMLGRLFSTLGLTSYAIYVLHVPLYRGTESLLIRFTGASIGQFGPAGGVAFLLVLILVCVWVDRVYDQPVRAWLRDFAPRFRSRTGRFSRPNRPT